MTYGLEETGIKPATLQLVCSLRSSVIQLLVLDDILTIGKLQGSVLDTDLPVDKAKNLASKGKQKNWRGNTEGMIWATAWGELKP